MPKNRREDFLLRHQEWVDHMYNGPYWVNRISPAAQAWWRWLGKHNRIAGTSWIAVGLLLLAVTWWRTQYPALSALYTILPIGIIVAGVRQLLRKPEPKPEPTGPPPLVRRKRKRRKGTKDE